MSTKPPQLICEENLSYAWGRAFLLTMERSSTNGPPLCISIGGFKDSVAVEDDHIRQGLDAALVQHGKYDCVTSALTIFPYKHWIRTDKPSCEELSDWYLNRFLPRLKARDRLNRRGTYFQRMIAFTGTKGKGTKAKIVTTNQLQHIINIWGRKRDRPKRPRQSALQVGCFDPTKDHTGGSVLGFPCLQQLSFSYDDQGGLALTAYYPTQYVFDRAYGNYLGLSHLGHFMAHELKLAFTRLNCYIGRPERGTPPKMALRELADEITSLLPQVELDSAPRSKLARNVIGDR